MAHDDEKKKEKVENDIKQPSEVLEEADKKTIEDFLSHEEDLEKWQEDLVTRSSNETFGSCDFEIDNLTVFVGVVEGNPSLEIVLNELDNFQAKYNDECRSHEYQVELLQDKEFINSLLSEQSISMEGETVMYHMKEPVIVEEREELAYLIDQRKAVGQTL